MISFAIMMILGQMNFYSTYVAARTASVGGNHAVAAREVLPRMQVSAATNEGGKSFNMIGQYQMYQFLTRGGGALSNPLRNHLNLKSVVTMHRWPTCNSPENVGDNTLSNWCL